MSTHQNDKLQFHQWSTLMLYSNITVEGLPQTLNTIFFCTIHNWTKKGSESALKKVHGQSVTASQLRANPYRLVNLICEDQVYLFQRQIPGTLYWKKFMPEVIAMVKQLWFMTLSRALFEMAWTILDISKNTRQWSNW